ncbi:hypothetical protein J6590_034765 [Homalodisca vitripennis]|nr:hypothetical protein J6590_034765 [Homalodisca vitripennis]
MKILSTKNKKSRQGNIGTIKEVLAATILKRRRIEDVFEENEEPAYSPGQCSLVKLGESKTLLDHNVRPHQQTNRQTFPRRRELPTRFDKCHIILRSRGHIARPLTKCLATARNNGLNYRHYSPPFVPLMYCCHSERGVCASLDVVSLVHGSRHSRSILWRENRIEPVPFTLSKSDSKTDVSDHSSITAPNGDCLTQTDNHTENKFFTPRQTNEILCQRIKVQTSVTLVRSPKIDILQNLFLPMKEIGFLENLFSIDETIIGMFT